MRHFLILCAFFCCVIVPAQDLSENAEISVITIGPGSSLNDAFGHSAFRIKDTKKGLDLVFNYGVYDFEAPNFILKFTQGKLDYLIGLNRFDNFYNAYTAQNRSITSQILNLSSTEKQQLFNYLINNYKPENRRYLYDFLFNNCATKIKEVTNLATQNPIDFNIPKDYSEATFRTLIQNNLNKNSWGSLGIDIALGSVIDRYATPEQHMFLPKNIHSFFDIATIQNSNTPLVKTRKTLFKASAKNKTSSFIFSPLFLFGILGLVIVFITYNDFKTGKRTKTLDFILFGVTGLAGVVIMLLWFATDHQTTKNNYNLLWANPLNLILLFQILKTTLPNWVNKFLKFLIILLCLLVFHWVTGVQVFAIALIPLLIALFIRYIFLITHSNTKRTIAP